MKRPDGWNMWKTPLILVVLLIGLSGCLSGQQAPEGSTKEEEYIDFKLGFSIVIPEAWQRQHTPVSSPKYDADRVDWEAPLDRTPPLLTIKFLGQQSETDLKKQLLAASTMETAKNQGFLSFQHPAGQALRLEKHSAEEALIEVTISDSKSSYLIRFKLSEEHFQKIRARIEKTILSFNILDISTLGKRSDIDLGGNSLVVTPQATQEETF